MQRKSIVLIGLAAGLYAALGLAGRAEAQSAPAPYLTASRYQDGGLLAGTIRAAPSGQSNFLATRYTYDSNQRLVKVETGTLASWPDTNAPANAPTPPSAWSGFSVGRIVVYSYDIHGHKTSQTIKGSDNTATNVTQFAYDALDRLSCTAERMNPAAFNSLPASACTFIAPGGNDPDRITTNTYDDLNRLIQVRRAVGVSSQLEGNEEAYATYSYTADGLREYIIDANGNRSKLTYDGHDRQIAWNFPSPTRPSAFNPATQTTAFQTAGAASTTDFESYTLDDNGNRTSLRKRDGLTTIAYQYDSLNRVWLKDLPGTASDVYYAYDLRGLQTYARFASTSGQGVTDVYDGFGRLKSTTTNVGSFSRSVGHGYDADGDRTSVRFPDNSAFTYTYDGLDRLTGIVENGGTGIVSQSYFTNGLRSGQTRGAVGTSYSYYPDERLHTWGDDLVGTASDVTWTLSYNSANQINSRTLSNDTYAFTGYTNIGRSYVVNGLNQYSNVAGSNIGYDSNGNLKSDGSTSTSYTYDAENRLLSVSGTYNATLSYDPLGRLCQIISGGTTTQFLYDGDELVAEYNGSTGALLRRYVHGPGEDDPLVWYEGASVSSATRRSLQANYQGSIESVADASGTAITINRYDEYGLPAATNGGRFQYTGQAWLPEVGVYYYKARLYDPRLARFLQTDPIGYQDDFNLYAYVANDPMSRADPQGLAGCGSTLSQPQCNQALAVQAKAVDAVKSARQDLKDLKSERAEIAAGGRSELSAGAQKTESQLNKYFKGSSDAVIGTVDKILAGTQTILEDSGSKYNYQLGASEATSKTITFAYASPFSSNIKLTAEFFQGSSKDQVETLVHEPSHIQGINVFPYQHETYDNHVFGLTRSQALNNADSYAQFAVP